MVPSRFSLRPIRWMKPNNKPTWGTFPKNRIQDDTGHFPVNDSIFFDGPPELVVVQSDQACHFRDTRFNRSLLLSKKLRQLTVPQFLPHYNMGAHPHFHRNPHIEWLVITVIDTLTSPYAWFYSRVFVQHPSEIWQVSIPSGFLKTHPCLLVKTDKNGRKTPKNGILIPQALVFFGQERVWRCMEYSFLVKSQITQSHEFLPRCLAFLAAMWSPGSARWYSRMGK